MQGVAVGFFLNVPPLDVAERASNILVDKHFSDLLPKGVGNFEGQPQVGVKPTVFNGVDRGEIPCLYSELVVRNQEFTSKHRA
jgi:hypothetical protein